MSTDLRPFDHDPEPNTDDQDVDAGEETVDEAPTPTLHDLEPDWEASEADVLDQHRDVPLDDDR